jgi:recombination protein RecR
LNAYPSKLLEEAVNEFARLPGIGRKTALRLVLHILRQPVNEANRFGHAVISLRNGINYCADCNNICESVLCNICANPKRDKSLICVVEDIRDVMAIENTGQYNGIYHVIGGIISPMDGIGPNQLKLENLPSRIENNQVKEIIMALSTTMEGDTTVFYISKKIKHLPVLISTIARGIAIGGELEYADEITLGRSIVNRMPYEQTGNSQKQVTTNLTEK